MYAANIRLYDPSMIDVTASASSKASKVENPASSRGPKKSADEGGLSRLLGSIAPGTSALFDYTQYPKFCSLLSGRDSVRPKARPLAWLMRLIEEIYDSRYAKDTADLQGEEAAKGTGSEASRFPNFVVDYFSKRYGLRGLIDQMCWDLLYNTHLVRKVSNDDRASAAPSAPAATTPAPALGPLLACLKSIAHLPLSWRLSL